MPAQHEFVPPKTMKLKTPNRVVDQLERFGIGILSSHVIEQQIVQTNTAAIVTSPFCQRKADELFRRLQCVELICCFPEYSLN
jgi:hypothetical protein